MNELLETLAKYNCQVEKIDGKIIITPKELEQPKQPKFKRGDILFNILNHCICIFNKYENENNQNFESIYNTYSKLNYGWSVFDFRLATEKEKQSLFKQLAKDGKRWNEETCEIETFKWKPNLHEDYYLPKFSERRGYFAVLSDTWDDVNVDNDRFTNWHIFKTKIECQKKCDELNKKIKSKIK